MDEHRYELIKKMGFDPELFTTQTKEGFIEVIKKKDLMPKIQLEP